MKQQQSFAPIGAATVATVPAGGSVAVANPALGTAANPGGAVLLTDAVSLAAPMFQVCGGTLSITPVSITTNVNVVNS